MNHSLNSTPKTQFQTASETAYSGAAELWAIEGALKKYNQDLVAKLSQYFKGSSRILEFGAGIGTLARIWNDKTHVKPECLEIDVKLREVIEERGLLCYGDLAEADGFFDGIYTSNVLEHIEHDEVILRQLHHRLRRGGTIAVYVPAFMCLYSSMDLAVGHYRRYGARELCQKLESAGFTVLHHSYSDSIGFLVWWYLKKRGSKGGNELSNHRALSLYDKFIYPLSSFIDLIGVKYLFGKNLLVVAKKEI
jgi:SAM-dependent methyltransferase